MFILFVVALPSLRHGGVAGLAKCDDKRLAAAIVTVVQADGGRLRKRCQTHGRSGATGGESLGRGVDAREASWRGEEMSRSVVNVVVES